jgi:hypothetical protein
MIREVDTVKTVLATALMLALGITGISLWGSVHSQRNPVSSSQIFIHGTPVCVMQRAGEIIAAVGKCDASGSESREEGNGNGERFHGGTLSPLEPRPGLPPGHPPVDSAPSFEGERRILI